MADNKTRRFHAFDRARPPGSSLMVPDCERFPLPGADGRRHEIFVHVPAVEVPPGGFPVLYLLDANADFLLVVETLRRLSRRPKASGIHPMVVVGIGYSEGGDYDLDRRYEDFTRGPPEIDDAGWQASVCYGGQAAFIDFVENRLKPFIRSTFPVREDQSALLGHSLAGYLVLDWLCQRPQDFRAFLAVSPSIWWGRETMLGRLAEQKAAFDAPRRAYLTVGQWEEEPAPWQVDLAANVSYASLRRRRAMIGNVQTFSEQLAKTYGDGVAVRCDIEEGGEHSSSLVTCLPRALRFAYFDSD
ncbi:alpha/beta hydrolase [Ciceribacter sp. RN22]|uniref:alpha/beta hydrolase n=1 Tax=Ciceribacter sp. RN22 TaxID=2954932 RepID=UPI002093B27B|nr:alpha/beta hydrolase-fold protein [Ciceribacter sp. RN22]MCO6179732.1 alpha/beta hydrolase-fold protein [Ciceribacter sp. RN22]